MLRALRTFLTLALVAMAIVPATAQAVTTATPQHTEMSIQATPAPAPQPDAGLFAATSLSALVGAAIMGRTAKGRIVALTGSYIFDHVTYGPSTPEEMARQGGTWVPEGFPDLDKDGKVIHPPGSVAERNAMKNADPKRPFSSPPSTGGVFTGEGQAGSTATVSGKSADELDAMTKGDLEALAEEKNILVTRQDEEGNEVEGDPLKADYVRALSKTA